MTETEILNDPSSDSFRSRLNYLVEREGGLSKFARKTGIPIPSVKKYLTQSEPTRGVLIKILSSLDLDPSWLILGEVDSSKELEKSVMYTYRDLLKQMAEAPERFETELFILGLDAEKLQKLLKEDDFFSPEKALEIVHAVLNSKISTPESTAGDLEQTMVSIPEFNFSEYQKHLERDYDFRAKGYRMKDFIESCEKKSSIAFRKSFLEKEFSGNPSSLLCYTMEDDSMYPEIPRGSVLLLDLERTNLQTNRTYLMRFHGNAVVRKVLEADSFQSWELIAGSKSDIKPIKQSVQKLAEANSVIALVTHVFKNCN